MNTQPNEILIYILSYLDNRQLTLVRKVNKRWKQLIEDKILHKPVIPPLYLCITTNDYYHFSKYYLNYLYCEEYSPCESMSEKNYYYALAEMINNKYIQQYISSTSMSVDWENVLSYGASKGHLEVVQYLISHGTNIHSNGDHAFNRSIYYGHFEITKYLIEQGVNIHYDHDFAFRYSASYGNLEFAKYLISLGADIHADHDRALLYSASQGHLTMVKYLVDLGLNIHMGCGQALISSAENNHYDVVEYLLNKAEEATYPIKGPNTPIHYGLDGALWWSARAGNLDIIKILIEHGASVKNDSALRIAATNSHYEVVKYLLDHGANFHALSFEEKIWYYRRCIWGKFW